MIAPALTVVLLAFQTPAASPVARIAVTPNPVVVAAGDTMRLRGEALDSAGRPVPNATVRFFAQQFEGHIDTVNVIHAGYRGILAVRAVAMVPGFRSSRPQTINVQIV